METGKVKIYLRKKSFLNEASTARTSFRLTAWKFRVFYEVSWKKIVKQVHMGGKEPERNTNKNDFP